MIHTQRLLNGMKRHAQVAQNNIQGGDSEGLVTAFDPATQTVKVMLQPANFETGWIQLKTPWAGNGFGLFSPPGIGDTVTVGYENGDIDSPSVHLKAHNDVDKPLPCPSGEFWLVHKSGQCIKLTNDGNLTLGGIGGAVGIVMLGDPAALHQMMTDIAMQVYNGHTHQIDGDVTGIPLQQMNTTEHLTQQTKAS